MTSQSDIEFIRSALEKAHAVCDLACDDHEGLIQFEMALAAVIRLESTLQSLESQNALKY